MSTEPCNHINCNCPDKPSDGLSILAQTDKNQAFEKFEQTKEQLKDNVKTVENRQQKPWVSLHQHSDFSQLDGCSTIDNYVKLAKKNSHPAMALTDHGNMSGTFEFYQKCKEAGIKPIIGMEAYVNDNMGIMEEKKYEGGNNHQSILVLNKEGYVNLNKLAYLSYTEGFYRRGRITTEWLIEHKNGLFLTTSCLASRTSRLLLEGRESEAEEYIKLLVREFQGNLAAELQFNESNEQKTYNEFIMRMSQKYNLPPILTNDVHYAYPEDNKLQDTIIAISQKEMLGKAFSLSARHLYYPSADDFHLFNKKFGFNYPEGYVDMCIENTVKISERFNFDFEVGAEKYPKYQATQNVIDFFKTDETKEIIRKLALGKLRQKLKIYKEKNIVQITPEKEKEYYDRLQYELKVVESKKMLDYFLVNWEIINFCKEKGYKTGPGRGSAAGSLLSFCLDITKIDPIRFDLYFERFLNPSRNSPPDIDIDFEMGIDDELDEFLYKKYGKERVLHVATFSKFNERMCLKDVVRAHRGQEATATDSDVAKVTAEMPDFKKVKYNLEQWFKIWPDDPGCSDIVRNFLTDASNKEILEQTVKLQGQVRGIGQHAAGVVITPTPHWEHLPTNIIASNKSIVTAFSEADGSSKDLSALGILKLDRLKLETLNVIKDTIELVKQTKGKDIQDDVDYVNLKDKNLFAELLIGLNHGVFQFESPGMNGLVRGIQVESFDELIATTSLYRPGPMSIGAHEEYVKNKHNPKNIKYVHPALESILKGTNGVLIYQEQLMFLVHKIGGISLGEGDSLRRYMDKASEAIIKRAAGEVLNSKDQRLYKDFEKYWNNFLDGAEKNGYKKEEVDRIKEWVIKYLGYSFNLSHATSYSYLTMQVLFLKHYYPTEFYASLLNHPKKGSGSDAEEKKRKWLAASIASAMSKGIKVLPPSLKSGWKWTMTGPHEISMGFSGINGFGDIAYNELKDFLEKKGKKLDEISITEFFDLPFSKFNKTSFEASLKAGVFDEWSDSRQQLIDLKSKKKKKKIDPNQGFLFDMNSEELSITNHLSNSSKYPPTSEVQKSREFLEVCNFNLETIERIATLKKQLTEKAQRVIESLMNYSSNDWYFFVVEEITNKTSEKGKKYLHLRVGDGISTTSIRIFEPMAEKFRPLLERGGFYVAKFEKNKKGFINLKKDTKLKRVDKEIKELVA